jgi:uncharacterized protein (DUF2252 family)
MDAYAQTGAIMNIRKATQSYEQWLAKQLTIVPADLKRKHEAMSKEIFPFFRATFYRWMQRWTEICPEEAKTPSLLAIGDLHVENFGTWRDVEGRLVWGVNDFDEAYTLPYTLDLVRLAASAHMAIDGSHLKIDHKDACAALLAGYGDGLSKGGRAFVLAESHTWLRDTVHGVLRDPVPFWTKMDAMKTTQAKIPNGARTGLDRLLPKKGLKYRVAHRVAGLGSLGRERYVALAEFDGGKIAREAKALALSACVWAAGVKGGKILYQDALDRSVRCKDPFVRLKQRWIVRRLAPDCSRVELSQLPKQREESKLLFAMGFETANIHLGTPRAIKAVTRDFSKRPAGWLHEAATKMGRAITKDWQDWRG